MQPQYPIPLVIGLEILIAVLLMGGALYFLKVYRKDLMRYPEGDENLFAHFRFLRRVIKGFALTAMIFPALLIVSVLPPISEVLKFIYPASIVAILVILLGKLFKSDTDQIMDTGFYRTFCFGWLAIFLLVFLIVRICYEDSFMTMVDAANKLFDK